MQTGMDAMDGDDPGQQGGRRLLALSASMTEDSAVLETGQAVLVLLALAVTVLLLLLLLLCVCRESSSSAELKKLQPQQNSTNNFHAAACRPDEVALEMTPLASAENGTPGSGNSLAAASSHSRQASSGSGTLRPTSLRELPSPPTSAPRPQSCDHGGSGVSSHLSTPVGRDDGDDYDHLNQRRRDKQVAANYDHITLPGEEESAALGQSGQENGESPAENYYTQVPDRTYDVVTDSSTSELDHYTLVQDKESTYSEVKDKGGPYSQVKDAGYAKVKDDGYTKVKDSGYAKVKDDGYAKVKDSGYAKVKSPYTSGGDTHQTFVKSQTEASSWLREDEYSKVSDGSDPYAKVKDTEDPYNKVVEDSKDAMGVDEDDTYCRVKDDDPYTGVQDGQGGDDRVVAGGASEGLAEAEDPYSTVGDDAAQTQVKMVSVIRIQSRSHCVTERHCTTTTTTTSTTTSATTVVSSFNPLSRGQQEHGGATGAHFNPSDDYAVVNKRRTPNPEGQQEGEEEEGNQRAGAPSEPPRAYLGSGVNHAPRSQPPPLPPPVVLGLGNSDAEHNYNKVTVRESLASMSARNALNPYELVADVENMYATVEGGSGDGVVVRQSQQPASLHSQPSETYEEIGATAGLGFGAAAPVPPSVDSLHLITQHHQEERGHKNCTSPDEGLHHRPDSQLPSGKTRSFSPTATALPHLPTEHFAPGAIASNGAVEDKDAPVTLDPNYHQVKDGIVPEVESEYDPNYESVEEARARGPPTWRRPPHVYEEMPLPQGSQAWARRSGSSLGVGHVRSRSDEATTVKERVLQSHTYEVITDVKNRHRKSDGGGN